MVLEDWIDNASFVFLYIEEFTNAKFYQVVQKLGVM